MPPPGYALEKHSSIIAIGLTVHNAPVELREKLAVPEAEWPRAIDELCAFPHIEEAAVLSTCNRMELYVSALSFHRGVREVEEWMVQASGVPLEELRPHLFLLRDRDATNHLLRVSGGLDSLVMGEGQILAQVCTARLCVVEHSLHHRMHHQVKQVYKVGQNCQGFGRQLNGLFKQAITAGKRVRAETSISSGAVSVSSAAAELAQLKLPTHNFEDAKVRVSTQSSIIDTPGYIHQQHHVLPGVHHRRRQDVAPAGQAPAVQGLLARDHPQPQHAPRRGIG